jgi:hypothetical protein
LFLLNEKFFEFARPGGKVFDDGAALGAVAASDGLAEEGAWNGAATCSRGGACLSALFLSFLTTGAFY